MTKKRSNSKAAKAKRARVRAAAVEAVGGAEKLDWLWKWEESKKDEPQPNFYLNRRLALGALAGTWILVGLAVLDVISFQNVLFY